MSRQGLAAAVRSELATPVIYLVDLIQIGFPGGTVYLTTADRDISWNSQTWRSNAPIISPLSGLQESPDGLARRVSFNVSGLDAAIVARSLSDAYSFAPVQWLQAFYNSSWTLLGTPYAIGDQLALAQATITLDRGTALIEIALETPEVLQQRDSAVLCSAESQHLRYPGDTGLDKTAQINSQVVIWGGNNRVVGTNGIWKGAVWEF